MPTLNPELTRTERLTPIGKPETGELVLVDKGWMTAIVDRGTEAATAVMRLNERMGGIKLDRRCLKAQLETGKMPTECPKTP